MVPAVVTSLPELANAISAVVFTKVPDLAVGDILGACMINMFTLACLDLINWVWRKQSIFFKPKKSNLLSTFVAIMMLFVTILALSLSRTVFDWQILNISIYTIIIIAIYFLAQYFLYKYSKEEVFVDKSSYHGLSLTQTYSYFLLAAVFVIAAGSWLPFIGTEIVATMGWGSTFVAVVFLGLATTLPELTVSVSALRLGEVGMSVGNLIGSNIFNIAILFVADAFYRQGSLLAAVSANMVYAALAGAILLAVAFFGMKSRESGRLPAYLMIFLYLASLFFLFKLGILA